MASPQETTRAASRMTALRVPEPTVYVTASTPEEPIESLTVRGETVERSAGVYVTVRSSDAPPARQNCTAPAGIRAVHWWRRPILDPQDQLMERHPHVRVDLFCPSPGTSAGRSSSRVTEVGLGDTIVGPVQPSRPVSQHAPAERTPLVPYLPRIGGHAIVRPPEREAQLRRGDVQPPRVRAPGPLHFRQKPIAPFLAITRRLQTAATSGATGREERRLVGPAADTTVFRNRPRDGRVN